MNSCNFIAWLLLFAAGRAWPQSVALLYSWTSLTKAFDTVNRDMLLLKLYDKGVRATCGT